MDKRQTKREYNKIFNEKIFPILRVQEAGRKRLAFKCAKLYIKEILFLFGYLILIYLLCKLFFSGDDFTIKVFFIIGASNFILICIGAKKYKSIIKAKQIEKEFRLHLKKECLPKILKAFGDIIWSDKIKVNKSFLLESRLYPEDMLMENKLISDDGFEGYYKNVHFIASEYYLETEKRLFISKNFSGLALLFEINKKFNSRTIVSTKFFSDRFKKHRQYIWLALLFFILAFSWNFPTIFLGARVDVSSIMAGIISLGASLLFIAAMLVDCVNPNKGLQKVKLEDVELDKKVNIDAQDQIEARCHLTPSFIDKFVSLKKFYNAKKVQCAFFDNKLLFVINTNKNLFEFGSVYKSLLKTNSVKTIFNEINTIYDIIDEFKLGK